MTASLARFLPDFELSGIRTFSGLPDEVAASGQPAGPAVDVDAVRAAARAEAEAAVRAELEAQHAQDREAEAKRHQAELEALRTELEHLAAQTIPQAVEARSAGIADLIASDVAEVLAPLVDRAIRTQVLDRLAYEIRGMLNLENAGQITIAGPEDLVVALREHLGGDAERVTVVHADRFDIEIEADRTRFASRLSDWTQALRDSLA